MSPSEPIIENILFTDLGEQCVPDGRSALLQ